MRDKTGRFGEELFENSKVVNLMESEEPKLPLAYTQTVGDGYLYVFTIRHGLGAKDVYVSVRVPALDNVELFGAPYGPGMEILDENQVQLWFPQSMPPPSPNSVRVTVMK